MQTVWLTATLPQVMQKEFNEYNKLIRPRIIQESTYQPSIKYMISFGTGPSTLVEKAMNLEPLR
jgi:hypothetical protein